VLGFTDGATGNLNKRALIVYIVRPFYMNSQELKLSAHSNHVQAIEIAKAFNRLGYVVDIVDYSDRTFTPTVSYDAFFGMGTDDNYDRITSMVNGGRKIYYGTGAYWEFENAAEEARREGLRVRRGIDLQLPERLGTNDWVQTADAVVLIGNQYVASHYRPHNPKVFPIDNSAAFTVMPDFDNKDFASARQNFLWFSSIGLLHKGLDIALETFSDLPDLHLWVCGPLHQENEQEFIEVYHRELFHTPNIHPVGWTNLYSDTFKELTDKCAFALSLTCAEGMPGGVLDCMGSGIIPVVNRESGIDTGRFGVQLDASTVPALREVLAKIANTPPDVCRRLAEETFREASTRYTLECFSQNIERILRTILDDA
jgi:hypothetical protein